MNKETILAEIRKIAASNNGCPPGKAALERETGIKESDWAGKFWANWSEALIEAGFEPNKFNAAYADEFLFEKFIQLARELKKYPTTIERKLKSRNDPSFPSHNTFHRIGSKLVLLEKLVSFCSQKDEYGDVLEIFSAELKNNIDSGKDSSDLESQNDSELKEGYVYLYKSDKHYKIGKTANSERRDREIKLQLPFKAEKVHEILTDDIDGIEKYWHERFKEKRLNGEWFGLSRSDVLAFKRRKFM